jgi:iron complex outermembrane receptor protein
MSSLERLPGVSTMDIGSGQSKPVIRGLGFNRVVVVENNIKHEAQQWGADHGLEIDQYAVNNVEVIKGPASLIYGSDAMGGIIDMKNRKVPVENSFGGTIDPDC